MMYVFEYLVYHLKPYGISTNLIVPLNQSRAASHTYASQTGQSETLTKQKNSAKANQQKATSLLMKDTQKMNGEPPSLQGNSDMQQRAKLKHFKMSNREANEVLSDAWNSKSNENHANIVPNQEPNLEEVKTVDRVKLEANLGVKSSTTMPSLTNYSKRHPRVKHRKWVPRTDEDR